MCVFEGIRASFTQQAAVVLPWFWNQDANKTQ